MGTGYSWQCPNCKYRFSADIGVGFLYPKVYAETIEAAKRGELGDDLKELLDCYPDAAIDPETVILQCSHCGDYDARPILTSYVPKEGEQIPPKEQSRRWSVAFPFDGASYVTGYDMQEYYDLYMEYDHRCKKCGGIMVALSSSFREIENGMNCPTCKKPLKMVEFNRWDQPITKHRHFMEHNPEVGKERISEKTPSHIICFVPDECKTGGEYVTVTGNVRRVDDYDSGR